MLYEMHLYESSSFLFRPLYEVLSHFRLKQVLKIVLNLTITIIVVILGIKV